MNVLKLKQTLLNIPDDAEIYIEADHGQSPEKAYTILATDEDLDDGILPYDGEDIDWKEIEDCDLCLIKGVLIGY
jgi:hypothetical protein